MNEAEKRRKRLLEQTRMLYRDDKENPAVHPRYKAAYNKLYVEESNSQKNSFVIRCTICILIFATYIMAGTYGEDFAGISILQVGQKIMQNYPLELY